jgi:hypothetical protein
VVLISVLTASTSQPSTSASIQPRVFSHSPILAGHSGTKGTWSIKRHTKTEGKIPRHILGDHSARMYKGGLKSSQPNSKKKMYNFKIILSFQHNVP